MSSGYAAHVMDRAITAANLEHLHAKKNFSVSHLLDLEDAREMAGAHAEESSAEAGTGSLESPGLTSGSDTAQQDKQCEGCIRKGIRRKNLGHVVCESDGPLWRWSAIYSSMGRKKLQIC